ncbi:MAG: DUF4428 domain-containing protein [Oscillospiraceae bacterium]|nr:DUF4428 domain-containing protein [Oscillospiraceae bacterium]MBQ9984908.1 DUF4428 domain-containing protein [Oscillospiraceae bacterium]
MAKHTCAICGAEVGLLSEQKLADGNYICRKVCSKKCLKIFDKVEATLDSVNSHIAQVEFGTKAWEQIFVPLTKTKVKEEKMKRFGKNGELYVSPSTGLVAITENRYKIFIFGKTTLACVYRLADLYGYDYESEEVKNSEGKTETKHFCILTFHNTPGMYQVRMEIRAGEFESMAKYFDTQFGIQKTLGNIRNTFKQQMDAAKAIAGAIGAIKDGTMDESKAAETVETLDAAQYGDRTEWIAKADAALATVQK